jgi:hypothetical protein
VQLNAVVKPSSGTSMPAGTVTLSEGGKTLAIAPLASGAARLSLTRLAPGTHIFTAEFSGDNQHQGSASLPLSQIVVTVNCSPANPHNPGAPAK